ncbi:hypothetical protein P9273_08450 [Mesorhizobium sp. WSM4935]|uniref:hypothetical protein n=1 Tax=Mesorhizobium sp. WSM4935 TaxID=3038547 RepID=UPI002414DAE9|nr:hypothetical protein [Mesorhizobium sp. WSM4935]MDG4875125.1 hypothetical protein [Mesorhizobium sp. WSM4935]
MTVESTNWHRPIVLPSGEPASSDANDLRHSVKDANIPRGALTGLQMDASPGLQESKTITAAVAGSIQNSLCWSFQRGQNRFVSNFAKIRDLALQLPGLFLGCANGYGKPAIGH